MQRIPYAILIWLLTLLPAPVVAQRPIERLFYYSDTPEAWASIQENIDRISILAPGGYSVDEKGVVWGDVDARLLRLARERKVPVMPLIVNPGFDQQMLHRFLADGTARQRAIASLRDLCRRNGYLGIQVDFENLGIDDRDAFTRFFRELATALHQDGYQVSAAVVHRTDDVPGPTRYQKWLFENWRAGYDLKALGEIGDFISIMSYSQHTRRTPPGPQHGMAWMRQVAEYFLRYVPARKLSLGISTNSMHWYTSQEDRITPEMARSYSEVLSYSGAMALASRYDARWRWDDEQQVSYTYFSNGGTFEWIFREDARSFAPRLALVDEYNLRGFSVWVLGPEDPKIWTMLPPQRRAPRR